MGRATPTLFRSRHTSPSRRRIAKNGLRRKYVTGDESETSRYVTALHARETRRDIRSGRRAGERDVLLLPTFFGAGPTFRRFTCRRAGKTRARARQQVGRRRVRCREVVKKSSAARFPALNAESSRTMKSVDERGGASAHSCRKVRRREVFGRRRGREPIIADPDNWSLRSRIRRVDEGT